MKIALMALLETVNFIENVGGGNQSTVLFPIKISFSGMLVYHKFFSGMLADTREYSILYEVNAAINKKQFGQFNGL